MHGRSYLLVAKTAVLSAGAPTGVLLLYLLLKTYGLNPAAGDENIYFYMSTQVADGLIPYRDFFFAHPPLHLLPGAILSLFVGFDLPTFKMIPVLATGATGWFVWRIGRREFGAAEGFVAVALFLLAHDVLRASSHFTGANLSVLCLLAGFDALLQRRDRSAGIWFACGALTAFYVAPLAMALTLARWVEDRKGGTTTIAVGLVVFAAVNGLFILLAGGAFLDEVYAYHLRKPASESAFASAFGSIAAKNPVLVWGPVVGLFTLALSHAGLLQADGPRRSVWELFSLRRRWESGAYRTLMLAGLASLVGLLFLANIAKVFHFYFLILLPFFALLGGFGYAGIGRGALAAYASWRSRRPWKTPLIAAAALLLLSLGADRVRLAALESKSWYRRELGNTRTYVWRAGVGLPSFLDPVMKAVFWNDERHIGDRHTGIVQYLWHESRVFTAGSEMADRVRTLDPDGGTLFGDSTSAPLVALYTGRRIALEEADTNAMRFRAGMPPPEEFLRRLAHSPPSVVVAHPNRGFFTIPEMRAWVERNYVLGASVRDPYQGTYQVYVRRK